MLLSATENFFFLSLYRNNKPLVSYFVLNFLQECAELTSSTRWGFVSPYINILFSFSSLSNILYESFVSICIYIIYNTVFDMDGILNIIQQIREHI